MFLGRASLLARVSEPANVLPLGHAEVILSRDGLRRVHGEVQPFMLSCDFGLREIETKISILRDAATPIYTTSIRSSTSPGG